MQIHGEAHPHRQPIGGFCCGRGHSMVPHRRRQPGHDSGGEQATCLAAPEQREDMNGAEHHGGGEQHGVGHWKRSVVNASDDGHRGEEVDGELPDEANDTASDTKAEADAAISPDDVRASVLPDLSTSKDPADASTSIASIEFREWGGMAAIVAEAWDAIGFGDADGVNGWAVLALTVGINEVATRISSNLDTISLISGLLLASCVQLMFAPPSCVSDNASGFRYAFAGTMMLAITMFFSAIMFGSLFVNALNTSARGSDRWRLILRRSMGPTIVYIIFSIACFVLGWAMSLGMVCLYGAAIAAIFSIVIAGVYGCVMHCINVTFLVSECHVMHGWFVKHRSEFDSPFRS
ncbi:hypothetical protein BBJ29_009662 [Phytophthora kernoviae]|uniref:Uncharacterized protein n=1 Tax=Phytophthora kernoviae TaxID=325452 RepID=A0A3R7JPV5_9STRA|nr:hypothetical protein BBJ29_009662 [Phytophthora kernoviae]